MKKHHSIKTFIMRIALSFVLIVLLLSFSSCSIFSTNLRNELPDDEIVSIVKVTVDESGEETQVALSAEKISIFNDFLKELKYSKKRNWLGVKTDIWDSEYFLITYENHTVKFSEHHFILRTNDEVKTSLMLDGVFPDETFKELFQLFDG